MYGFCLVSVFDGKYCNRVSGNGGLCDEQGGYDNGAGILRIDYIEYR